MLQLLQEPFIYLRQLMNLVDGIILMHCLGNDKDTLISRFSKSHVNIGNFQFLVFHETMHTLSNHTQSLLDCLFKVSSDSHHFAYRFHAGAKFLIYTMKLREIPTWDFAYNIIQGRFKESTCSFRYGILQFEQSISQT